MPAMLAGLGIASFVVAFIAVRVLLSRFGRFALDQPNARSLHERPVPRTGGIAVLFGVSACLPFGAMQLWLPLVLALALAVISFIDDLRGTPTGVRRFLYMSSVKADHPEPDDRYARAKLAAEEAVARVASRSGLETVILRPPLVYGPRVRANFLALMRAVDRGWPLPFASIENRRSLLYVENLCDAIARCLEAEAPDGRTFFVTDGAPVSTAELCRQIGAALGRPALLFSFPPAVLEWIPGMKRITRSLAVDDSAIRRELNWQPPFTFEQGLRATTAWYRGR